MPTLHEDAERVLAKIASYNPGMDECAVGSKQWQAARRLAEFVQSLELTPDELAALDVLRKIDPHRTPGPWRFSPKVGSISAHVPGRQFTSTVCESELWHLDSEREDQGNAFFISACGTHLPALLRLVERLTNAD